MALRGLGGLRKVTSIHSWDPGFGSQPPPWLGVGLNGGALSPVYESKSGFAHSQVGHGRTLLLLVPEPAGERGFQGVGPREIGVCLG